MHAIVPFLIGLFVILGIGLALAHILLRRTHGYLLFLGIAFLAFAISLPLHSNLRWIPQLVALIAVIIAVREGILDTRERLQHFREEQEERAAAFGEYMEAIAHADADKRAASRKDR